MIVAWQFTARNRFNKRNRPVGNGVIGAEGTFYHLEGVTREQTNSDRTLRDGSFSNRIPGSKLPGYVHLVPSGQRPQISVRIFDSISQFQSSTRTSRSMSTIQRSADAVIGGRGLPTSLGGTDLLPP